MSQILNRILKLVGQREILISEHGYDELSADAILVTDVCDGVVDSVVVEEYPDYHKGPCVLVLQRDRNREPVHVLWGIPAGAESPAVVVTAYRPSADRWTGDFLRRRQ